MGLTYEHCHRNGHATLASSAYRRTYQSIDYMLLISIRQDNHVVLGTGKALNTLHIAGSGFVDITANRHGTYEGHGFDGGIR